MNRRKFLKQGLTIGLLPLLPNITMSQVRPTIELELFLDGLTVAFEKGAIAGRNLGVAFEEASVAANVLSETLSEQEIKQSIEKLVRPNEIAKNQLSEMGMEIYEAEPA